MYLTGIFSLQEAKIFRTYLYMAQYSEYTGMWRFQPQSLHFSTTVVLSLVSHRQNRNHRVLEYSS